jgi:hypothetical protein
MCELLINWDFLVHYWDAVNMMSILRQEGNCVGPSHCRVCHHVAVGWSWHLLYRLHVILDLDTIQSINSTGSSQQIMGRSANTVQIPSSPTIKWYQSKWNFIQPRQLGQVLATSPGNQAAVQVRTVKMVRFGSKPIQKADQLHLGGPNADPYPSTCGFCPVWLDQSVQVSGFSFRVFLFMVTFRYPISNHKILTSVYRCL